MNAIFCTLSIVIIILSNKGFSQELDQELLNSLKIEANHNLTRLKSLKTEKKNNKVYDEEREKSLGLYLVEQEKWDLIREKGLFEYRKQKKTLSPQEGGPEFQMDLKEKRKLAEKAEKSREIQVRTRNQILNQNPGVVAELENEELGLTHARPRFLLRKRGQNKWVKSGNASGGRPAMGGNGFTPTPSDLDSGFPPPPTDYVPAPPPNDGYEEVPPPPPPNYDYGSSTSLPYDAGYGDIPPPPPPPPIDYDF